MSKSCPKVEAKPLQGLETVQRHLSRIQKQPTSVGNTVTVTIQNCVLELHALQVKYNAILISLLICSLIMCYYENFVTLQHSFKSQIKLCEIFNNFFAALLIQMQMNPLKFNSLKLLQTFSENN